MRTHFPKSAEEAKAFRPRVRHIALASRVLVASITRVECTWRAYCDAVVGWKHTEEVRGVLDHGDTVPERIARAMFPEFDEIPYSY